MSIFGMIGIFFVILARNPLKYGTMLPFAGYGLLCYGMFWFLGGLRYQLPVWTFSGDVIIGLVAGILILALRKRAMRAEQAEKFDNIKN